MSPVERAKALWARCWRVHTHTRVWHRHTEPESHGLRGHCTPLVPGGVMIDICMALNDLLHQHRWEDADKLLRDAIVSEPAPVLIALAMFSTGAARHLPSRNMLFEHVLLHEEMSPQTRVAFNAWPLSRLNWRKRL